MELGKLVEQVKGAITATTPRLQKAGLRVASFELNLKVVSEESGGAKFDGGGLMKLLVPLSVGGSSTDKSTQQFKMTFEVEPPTEDMGDEGVQAHLESAIAVVCEVAEASKTGSTTYDPTLPTYSLKDSSIILELGVTKEGKLSFFFDFNLKSDSTNTITLNLTSAKQS